MTILAALTVVAAHEGFKAKPFTLDLRQMTILSLVIFFATSLFYLKQSFVFVLYATLFNNVESGWHRVEVKDASTWRVGLNLKLPNQVEKVSSEEGNHSEVPLIDRIYFL